MKSWLGALVLGLTVTSIANAQVAKPNPDKRGLVCESALTINFEGGRYGDRINFDAVADEIRPLLRSDEQKLELANSELNMSLSMGSCSRGTGDVLVECHYGNQKENWAMTNYSFEFSRPDPTNPAFNEGVTLHRSINAKTMSLTVTKQPGLSDLDRSPSEEAIMHLVLDADGPTGPVHLDVTRRVGEWTSAVNRSNYDRCVFE
jgi:hypothetical protein